jgi:ABC-type uncharacterized transport system permease subunit
VQQSASSLGTQSASDVNTLDSEITGTTQYAGNALWDALPRVVAGLGAVVLIGAGLWMIGRK